MQYTSAQHARLAKRHGARLSVGWRGQCWDNAVAESFFSTIKTELIHRQAWPTRKEQHEIRGLRQPVTAAPRRTLQGIVVSRFCATRYPLGAEADWLPDCDTATFVSTYTSRSTR